MCGRYYFEIPDNEDGKKIKKLVEELKLTDFKSGEVFPGEKVLVFKKRGNNYEPCIVDWGMHINNQLVINAKSETLKEKVSFKNSQPCIIICNGFYEWHNKEKYYIKQEELMYLAGIYNQYYEMCIITGKSEFDMALIHERTPLIIPTNKVKDYLDGNYQLKVNNQALKINKCDLNNCKNIQ